MGKHWTLRDRARFGRLARISALAGILTSTFGSPVLLPLDPVSGAPVSPQVQSVPLAPRAVVSFSVEAAQGLHMVPVMHAEDYVGPDGTLQVGPYGVVPVAGLTVEQARVAVERHLAPYLRNPRVRLTLVSPARRVIASSSPGEVEPSGSWRPVPAPQKPAQPAGNEPVAQLGAPAPLPAPLTAGTNWRPVARNGQVLPVSIQPANVVQTTWHAPNRPAAGTDNTVAQLTPAGIAAPMPEGPMLMQNDPKSEPPPEPKPKSEDLKIAPRKVPPQGVPVHGLPPALPPDGMPGMDGAPAPTECKKVALPSYVIEPPDILVVASTLELRDQPIQGPHLVRPDGTISLGIYGSAYVAGMTLDQARDSIIAVLSQRIRNVDRRNVYVDVMAYNSKFYYVITDGAGYGETVIRFPITGSETVLDAISQIYGIPPVGSKKHIWVARSFPCGGHPQTLPVDWCAITKGGDVSTNYQLMPGDRIYVQSQKIIRADSMIAKFISPFERIFGVTLLASSAINSIHNGGNSGTVR